MILLLIIGLIVCLVGIGLCVAHAKGHRMPPKPQQVQHVQHVLAEDAWSSLLGLDKNDPEYPKRWIYSDEKYKEMRERKLSDWVLP